jgi:hypothetical protein
MCAPAAPASTRLIIAAMNLFITNLRGYSWQSTYHILRCLFASKISHSTQVRGCLDSWWAQLFEGMTIAAQDNVTTISGLVPDQAALHGMLAKLRDFGLVLLSVKSGAGEKEFS